MVIEQINSQNPTLAAPIPVTDCAGNAWNINTAEGAAPAGQGASLMLNAGDPSYGGIDQSQAYAAIQAGYAMRYVDCAGGGPQTVYEVRWNVMTVTANEARLVTASARQMGGNQYGNIRFAFPVTLRSIGGP
jgi:hypothetical protein